MVTQSLGPVIGSCYVPNRGMGTVYATVAKDSFDVQIDRTGERLRMPRARVQWRKAKEVAT